MANSKERVLLYQFPADQAALITGALRPMGVELGDNNLWHASSLI